MKTLKPKLSAILLTGVVAAAMALPTFAARSSTSAPGYGTLYGTITSSGRLTTSVSYNNDQATLLIGGTQADRNGNTLVTQQNLYSSRGAKSFNATWTNIFSNTYALYGAHGVQGGSTHGASATYTYTKV